MNAARDFLRRWDFMSVDDEAVSVEVRDKTKRVRERLDNGAAVKDSRRRVADWQGHWRATTLVASDRTESTRELYANLSRRHLETGRLARSRSISSSHPTGCWPRIPPLRSSVPASPARKPAT